MFNLSVTGRSKKNHCTTVPESRISERTLWTVWPNLNADVGGRTILMGSFVDLIVLWNWKGILQINWPEGFSVVSLCLLSRLMLFLWANTIRWIRWAQHLICVQLWKRIRWRNVRFLGLRISGSGKRKKRAALVISCLQRGFGAGTVCRGHFATADSTKPTEIHSDHLSELMTAEDVVWLLVFF